ncbi:DUF1302 family protein [Solimonas sp. K1W22B-7]|nr:DUF1302 family protein [Solimonas sp. K1W22B-7]
MLALMAALSITGRAAAVEFDLGESGVSGELKAELAVGARVRMQDRDSRLLGKLNVQGQQGLCGADGADCAGIDGNARYLAAKGNLLPDYDNGDLNYDQYDLVAATSRLSVQMKLSRDDWGIFTRGLFYYDPVNDGFEESHPNTVFQPAHTRRPRGVEDEIGRRVDLMEAYVYGSVPFFNDNTLNITLGRQNITWGESNFLVLNSINTINPPSANRLEFPVGTLNEAFTPVPMLLLGTNFGNGLSAQVFYQFGWEPVELESAGSYYSTDDTTGTGGRLAHLQGQTPEDPDNQIRPNAPLSNSGRTFYRDPDREPRDGGQYGAELKFYAEELGEGTTFGLYFANYHNRLPIGSFIAADASSCRQAPEALDSTPLLVLPFCLLGGEAAPVDTIRYFLEYPEDVQMIGASVVSPVGEWSFQGEYAFRPNLPIQVDAVDLSFAALQPAFPRQDVPVPLVGLTIPGARHGAPDYIETIYRGHTVMPGDTIKGYERMKVGQLNLSALRLASNNPFHAAQWLMLIEAGLTHVLDMPSLNQLQFEGPGTSASYAPGIDGTGDPDGTADPDRTNPTQQKRGFATQVSWGYRVYQELEYPDGPFGLTWKPNLLIAHDVQGTAPGPGGNFIEGRMEFDLGLTLKAQELWSANLVYVWYTGADEFNLLRDRDNLAANVIFNF